MSTFHAIIDFNPALPPKNLLIEIAKELTKTCRTAEDYAAMRSFDKAAYHLEAGVMPILSAGDFLVPSATTVGQIYRVSGEGCNCSAGLKGRQCWHAVVAEIVMVAWQRQSEQGLCDDDDMSSFTPDPDDIPDNNVSRIGDVEIPFVPTPMDVERERRLAAIYEAADDWYMAA